MVLGGQTRDGGDATNPLSTICLRALKDARGCTHDGCCNANVPGREGSLMERWHSLPRCLERVLHDGVEPGSREREVVLQSGAAQRPLLAGEHAL